MPKPDEKMTAAFWKTDTPILLQQVVRENFPVLYSCAENTKIELLKNSENLTFSVFAPTGTAILRVNRPFYHTEEELRAELRWMELIRRDGAVAVPEVYAGKDGNLLQSFVSPQSGTRYFCSLFSFLPGKTVRELHGQELLEKTAGIGAIAASLHRQAQENCEVDRLPRFSWDFENLLGPNARWGSWREYPGLTADDRNLFREAVIRIGHRLENYGKGPSRYGLIHSDLHLSNVIADGDALQVIDFDDCGYGWFLYDLGCSLVEYSENLPALTKAWLSGYQTKRSLTKEDRNEIPTFLLLRRIVRLAWLSSHSGSDTAKSVGPEYLIQTRRMARLYQKGSEPVDE